MYTERLHPSPPGQSINALSVSLLMATPNGQVQSAEFSRGKIHSRVDLLGMGNSSQHVDKCNKSIPEIPIFENKIKGTWFY